MPELQANSTLRCAAWHALVAEFEEFAEFAAERLRRPVDALMPQALAHGVLGAATAAFERWLHDEEADLGRLLDLLFAAGWLFAPAGHARPVLEQTVLTGLDAERSPCVEVLSGAYETARWPSRRSRDG